MRLFCSYSLFSLIFGNAFGAFVATPLTAASFFITARWDRIRESKDISLQYLYEVVRATKIDFKNIGFGIFIIFFVQTLISALVVFLIYQFSPDSCPICDDLGYFDIMDKLTDTWIGLIVIFFIFYSSYLIGGYFSASYALRKNTSPYLHAIGSALIFTLLNFFITEIISFLEKGESFLLSESEEISVGAKILLFGQFIVLPLIGATIAVRKAKPEEIEKAKRDEEDKKAKEEFANVVTLEVERVKNEASSKKKKKTVTNKIKKKPH